MFLLSIARSRAGYSLVEVLAVLAIAGLLAGLGFPRLRGSLERARVARAVGDLRAIQADLMAIESQGQPLPPTLDAIGRGAMRDPWGRAYVYLPFPPGRRVPPGARRDRFLVPVNSTFDLYSLGRDGQSAPPFTAAPSLDDVVRANDGGYLGLAANY